MTVHSPGLVYCRSNDLGMDFCWGRFWQFFCDFGGAQKYTLILYLGFCVNKKLELVVFGRCVPWQEQNPCALCALTCVGTVCDTVVSDVRWLVIWVVLAHFH